MITQTLTQLDGYVPELRYVTDAGCHPQAFYRDVLEPMLHPVTDEPLSWSWGVDFYHACEYVSSLANSILGAGEKASAWAEKQRRAMRDKANGVQRVISAAPAPKGRRERRPPSRRSPDTAETPTRPEGNEERLCVRHRLLEEVS